MSEQYYDTKGIGHYSTSSRDRANEKYLREEQYARDEQLTIARKQKESQDAHNAKIAAIAKKEAAEAKAQREFDKDVLWLEKSNAEGKVEYISNKISDGFKSESVRIILAKTFDCTKQVKNNQELSKIIKDLSKASAEWLKIQKKFDDYKSIIDTAKSKKEKIIPLFWRGWLLALSPILGYIASWIHIFNNSNERHNQTNLWMGYFTLIIWVSIIYFFDGRTKIKSLQKTIDFESSKIEILKVELQILDDKRKEMSSIAKTACHVWFKNTVQEATESATTYESSSDIKELFKEKFIAFQLKYPNSCRVRFESVDENFLKKFMEVSMNDVRNDVIAYLKSERFISSQLTEVDRVSEILNWVELEMVG
jgi:hypothetical protein